MMRLALYKGPATGAKNKLGHWVVCVATASKYSHVELMIDGVCYSSSFRDGGVRAKVIDAESLAAHFDLFDVKNPPDEATVLARFAAEKGKPYSWRGMLRVCPVLRWLPRRDSSERFCSDLVSYLLGATDPETFSPENVREKFV